MVQEMFYGFVILATALHIITHWSGASALPKSHLGGTPSTSVATTTDKGQTPTICCFASNKTLLSQPHVLCLNELGRAATFIMWNGATIFSGCIPWMLWNM